MGIIQKDKEKKIEMKEKEIILQKEEEKKIEPIHINKELMNEFDPDNIEIMKKIQNDLKETMETMHKLALHRTVYNDIFRPVHSVCPKRTYRGNLTECDELNFSVISRNTFFGYIELKMIDPQHPELSEYNIYMTPHQLFKHSTTYFHFADMEPLQNISKSNTPKIEEKIIHHNI